MESEQSSAADTHTRRVRHILLIVAAVLLALAGTSFILRGIAHIDQSGGFNQLHYRWRSDNGDKLSATWLAPQDMSILQIPKNETRRLRMTIANEGPGDLAYIRYQLEYATSIENEWMPVGLNGSTKEHWAMSYSPYILDGVSTTNLPDGIDDPPGIFVAGEVRDTDNRTGPISLPPLSFTELEFAVRPTDSAVENGTYYFRIGRARTTTQETIQDAISVSTGIAIVKVKAALKVR
jgi:hypothetical protein